MVSSVHSKPSRSKIITLVVLLDDHEPFDSKKKKLLAKHSYAALLFPSLSRSFYFLTAFYFLTVRLSPFHSTFIHGQTGPFTPIVPAGGHWMLSAVPIQRLFHQLAWNYFERFHRPLNKTNNARTKSRQRRQKGRNCFSKNRVWTRKKGGKGRREGESNDLRGAIRETCMTDVFFHQSFENPFDVSRSSLVIFSFLSFFRVFVLKKKLWKF